VHCLRNILSFLVLAALVCTTAGCPRKVKHPKKPAVVGAHRLERGPHGAPVAFWEDEYVLEVSIDRKTKEASVYVLKDNGSVPRPIEASSLTLHLASHEPPLDITLKPAPLEEDPQGSASCFKGHDPAFGSDEAIYGTVAGKVGDQDYIGEFDERARSPVLNNKGKKK
jgi:hypothetical protein